MENKKLTHHRDRFIDPSYMQSPVEKLDIIQCKQILDELICPKIEMKLKIDALISETSTKLPCPKCSSNRTYYCSKCNLSLLKEQQMPFFSFPVEAVMFVK